MSENVATQLVQTLAQAGVRRIFGVVGDSLNGLTEALRRQTDDRLGPCRATRRPRPSRRPARRRSRASWRSAPARAARATCI